MSPTTTAHQIASQINSHQSKSVPLNLYFCNAAVRLDHRRQLQYKHIKTSSSRAWKQISKVVTTPKKSGEQTWTWSGAGFTRQTPSEKQTAAPESSLLYKRARYYDPNTGEFVSRDPLGFVDGMSQYRAYFVPGSVDPTGLFQSASQVWKFGKKLSGHIGTAISTGAQIWEATGPSGVAIGLGTNGGTSDHLVLQSANVHQTTSGLGNWIATLPSGPGRPTNHPSGPTLGSKPSNSGVFGDSTLSTADWLRGRLIQSVHVRSTFVLNEDDYHGNASLGTGVVSKEFSLPADGEMDISSFMEVKVEMTKESGYCCANVTWPDGSKHKACDCGEVEIFGSIKTEARVFYKAYSQADIDSGVVKGTDDLPGGFPAYNHTYSTPWSNIHSEPLSTRSYKCE